jgi:hypothetical protein
MQIKAAKIFYAVRFNNYALFEKILDSLKTDADKNNVLNECGSQLETYQTKCMGFQFFNNLHQRNLNILEEFIDKYKEMPRPQIM